MRSFLCPVIGEKTAAPPPWPPKKDPLFSFQRPCSPLPVSKRRSPLRKRPGSDKPVSLHFLRFGLEWEGLVYCGAFARTIKKILPQGGSSPSKESFICIGKEILKGGKNETPDNTGRSAPFGAASAFAEAMEGLFG